MKKPNKIVILGAAGAVGTHLLFDLVHDSDCEEIIAADINFKHLEEFEELQPYSHRFKKVVINANDTEKIFELVKGADLFMNCTSFINFDKMIDIAIKAKVNYADLISHPTPEQEEAVKAAGIVAVSGLGIAPGLTNVVVRDAVDEFDSVESAEVAFASFRSIAPSRGLLDTIVWELADSTKERCYCLDGVPHYAHAGDGAKLYEFPAPIGWQMTQYVPHTEAITLAKNFPKIRWCAARGTWRPEIMDAFVMFNRFGLLDTPESIEAVKEALWRRFGGKKDGNWEESTMQVHIQGQHEGVARHRVYHLTHPQEWQDVCRITGVCAAVGAYLIATNGANGITGFVDPEIYFDPKEFLAELAKRGTVNVRVEEEDV